MPALLEVSPVPPHPPYEHGPGKRWDGDRYTCTACRDAMHRWFNAIDGLVEGLAEFGRVARRSADAVGGFLGKWGEAVERERAATVPHRLRADPHTVTAADWERADRGAVTWAVWTGGSGLPVMVTPQALADHPEALQPIEEPCWCRHQSHQHVSDHDHPSGRVECVPCILQGKPSYLYRHAYQPASLRPPKVEPRYPRRPRRRT